MPDKILTYLDNCSVAYAQWILRHSKTVLLVSLLVVAFFGVGLRNISLNNNYDVFFDGDDIRMRGYTLAQETYTTDDTVFFIVTANGGEVFDRSVLEAIAYLTDRAWELPHATRVDSLTTYHHAHADGDDLLIAPLVHAPGNMSDAELAEARLIAHGDTLLRNRLIKEGSAVSGVNVTINLPENEPRVTMHITEAAEALMAETMEKFQSVSIRLTGLVPLNNTFLAVAMHDLTKLGPVMAVVIVLTMTLLLKSISLMAAVMLCVFFAAASAVGVMSWLHYDMDPMLPVIVMTLTVADCVHILVSMQSFLRKGMDKPTALVESMRVNMLPVFITSLTTGIGFLCMNFTPVPILRILGNFTAIGVLLAFWLSVFFLPAAVYHLPFRVRVSRTDQRVSWMMGGLAEIVLRHKHALCIFVVALAVLIVLHIPNIRMNNQFIEWFDKDYPIRRDTEYAMEHLTGIYQVIFDIPAAEAGGVTEPEYLGRLDAFVGWLREEEGVVHVSGITDTLKRMHQAMHDDEPGMYRIPESRALAAQYLLLYEMSLPLGMDLNTEVAMDKSATRVVVTTSNLHSHEMTGLVAAAEAWQQEHFPAYMQAHALGPAVMFAEAAKTIVNSMMISAPLAMLLVSLVLMAALRSVKYGLISLAPNVLPIVAGFGLWGLLGYEMNFGMATIAAMSVGIVVDDTVHFLSKYLRARRELHLSSEDGVRYAFASVGKAMWVTSFVLVAGFMTLTLSPMVYCRDMGLMTSFIIVAALVCDFLLLPALLVYSDGAWERSPAPQPKSRQEDTVVCVET